MCSTQHPSMRLTAYIIHLISSVHPFTCMASPLDGMLSFQPMPPLPLNHQRKQKNELVNAMIALSVCKRVRDWRSKVDECTASLLGGAEGIKEWSPCFG